MTEAATACYTVRVWPSGVSASGGQGANARRYDVHTLQASEWDTVVAASQGRVLFGESVSPTVSLLVRLLESPDWKFKINNAAAGRHPVVCIARPMTAQEAVDALESYVRLDCLFREDQPWAYITWTRNDELPDRVAFICAMSNADTRDRVLRDMDQRVAERAPARPRAANRRWAFSCSYTPATAETTNELAVVNTTLLKAAVEAYRRHPSGNDTEFVSEAWFMRVLRGRPTPGAESAACKAIHGLCQWQHASLDGQLVGAYTKAINPPVARPVRATFSSLEPDDEPI
jgi:hypothetical protein